MSDLRNKIASEIAMSDLLAGDEFSDAECLPIADLILALPDLRALAAGELLYRHCGECHGVRTVPDTVQPHWGRRPCPTCDGIGFVPVKGTTNE
jgi:mono/diheme cytochrome c family protein